MDQLAEIDSISTETKTIFQARFLREFTILKTGLEKARDGSMSPESLDAFAKATALKIARAYESIERLYEDPMLEGFYTKKHFNAHLRRVIDQINSGKTSSRERGQQYKGAVLVFIDLDEFKKINDRLGHDAGDKVLIGVASVIQKFVKRKTDILGHQTEEDTPDEEQIEGIRGRFGGDELTLVLDDTDLMGAAIVLGRIAHSLRTAPVANYQGQEIFQTASIGAVPLERGMTFDEAFKKADQAAYMSKTRGRDQVTIWNSEVGRYFEETNSTHS